MTKIRIAYIYILSVLFLSSFVNAQTTSLSVEHSDEIYTNKPFVLQYIYRGSKNPEGFNTPNFPAALQIMYGPAQSVSMSTSSINGHTTSSFSVTYTYTIVCSKAGEYTIPKVSIKDENGNIISCNSTTIKVLANPSKDTASASAGNTNSPIAFIPVLSKKSVYIYQSVYMFMRIYHLFDDARPSFDKYPIFNGFINELLSDGSSSMGSLGVDRYNGRNYKTITFGKSLLIPTQVGKLKVGPIETDLTYTIPSDDPDDFFNFGSQTVRRKIISSISTLDVKPLPEKGKPDNFTGLVGNFTAHLSANKTDFKTSDAITFKLEISGVGYLKPINIPSPKFPQSFDVYDPTTNYTEDIQMDGVHCSKTIEYVVVPNKTGNFTIPSLDISYFDPNTSEYKFAKTEPIVMNISKGANISNSTIVSNRNNDSSVLIDRSLSGNKNISNELSIFNSITYWIIYLIVLLLGFISILFINKYRKDREDIVSFNASRAKSVARKRLSLALKYAKDLNKEDFYEEIMKALWQYASYKLKISSGDINMDKAINGFITKGLSNDECNEFVDLISISEAARFSGFTSQDNLNEIYERSVNFIALVENKKIK